MRKRLAIGVCTSILLASCTDSDKATGPTQSNIAKSVQLQIAAAVAGRDERGIEDDILRMEAQVPGLGGAFVENGKIVVLVPEGALRSNVMSGLARASAFLLVDPTTRGRFARGEQIELRPAKYAFSQLLAWQDAVSGVLGRSTAISYTDADERSNKLAIGIVSEKYRQEVETAAQKADVPLDALDIEVQPLELPLSTLRSSWNTSSSPTKAGVQISDGYGDVCTIGWNYHRGADFPDASAEEGFYTAGHCVHGQPGAGIAGYIYQPLSTSIGYITQNPAWNVTDTACTYTYCTQVDAMYVKYTDPTISSKTLAQTASYGTGNSTGSITYTGYWGNLTGTNFNFLVGDYVDKIGRTTGWTRGTLYSTCKKTNVGPPNYSAYTVLCANRVSGAAFGEGDSGGPVFQIGPDSAIVKRGTLFAGTGVMSTNDEGLQYCTASCVYSYNTINRILLFLREPPY